MDLQVEKFARRNVELLPDNMDLLSDTELTQYFIQRWSLEYNDPSKRIQMTMHNIITLILVVESKFSGVIPSWGHFQAVQLVN